MVIQDNANNLSASDNRNAVPWHGCENEKGFSLLDLILKKTAYKAMKKGDYVAYGNQRRRNSFNNLLPVSGRTCVWTLFFIAISIFTSCKKTEDKKAPCRIVAVNFPMQNLTYHLTYLGNGKLSKLAAGNTVLTYEYSGNKVTITILESGQFAGRTIATLNAAGLAIKVRDESNFAGTEWANADYEYNGTELSKFIFTSFSRTDTVVTTYSWQDHNLTGVDTVRTAYQYYSDKPGQTGDYFSLTQLVQGYEIVRNKNLVKSVNGQHLTYQFGTNGISSLTTTYGNDSNTIDYEYECK